MTGDPKTAPRAVAVKAPDAGSTGAAKVKADGKVKPCSFIEPPDFLKKKVVKDAGPDVEEVVARADQALHGMRDVYLLLAQEEIQVMEAAIARARACDGEERDAALREVFDVAHEMRGQAGSFGYDLATVISTSLCDYIEDVAQVDARRLDAIAIHADALKAVIGGRIEGDGGKDGRRLLGGMKVMVEKTLGG